MQVFGIPNKRWLWSRQEFVHTITKWAAPTNVPTAVGSVRRHLIEICLPELDYIDRAGVEPRTRQCLLCLYTGGSKPRLPRGHLSFLRSPATTLDSPSGLLGYHERDSMDV